MYQWSHGETSEDVDGLIAGTYSVVVTNENGFSNTLSVIVPPYSPSAWTVEETGSIHQIHVPTSTNITIDYDSITYGDYLAVTDLEGNIGGMMMWNGEEEVLNVYGSVFNPGQIFNWLIWDASTNTYHPANPVYDEDNYDNTDLFVIGGESGILDLVTRELFMQQINLPQGWGMYSTFISPENGALETVLADVVENLVIMKDENGGIFWPLLGINTIINLTEGEGYQIKMGTSDLLEIEGDLIPSDLDMFTPGGWSYIAYLHQASGAVDYLMEPFMDNLILLKDGEGAVYWPFIGVSTLILSLIHICRCRRRG